MSLVPSQRLIGRSLAVAACFAHSLSLNASTHFFAPEQLPEGETLVSLGLGAVPVGPPSQGVRLVEWASLPGEGLCQQIVPWNDHLYFVLKEGRIWRYGLDGEHSEELFLDVDALRPGFLDSNGWAPSTGLRGLAFHPDYDSNGLVYTIQKESDDGNGIEFGSDFVLTLYVLGEWNFNQLVDGQPTFREIFRISFEHDYHTASHIGFNPQAAPGDPDYGLLYCTFGDNGWRTNGGPLVNTREESDISRVGQDFSTIQSSVIRIDPRDLSILTEAELALIGRKPGINAAYTIPLDNPFVGVEGSKEEIFAKGFRHPLTLSFGPNGEVIVGEAGDQAVEEINVAVAGGNYGWPIREGTFIACFADQDTGEPLGADASMRWVPDGDSEEPAVTYWVRDPDRSNPRQETVARSGPHDDGYIYPVFQFTHEGNASVNASFGRAAVVGGEYYSGFWAEEIEGLYLFGNLSTDQIFYGSLAALQDIDTVSEAQELPIIDDAGELTTFTDVVGDARANMRFGRDRFGNIYVSSKADQKVYRLQGTPEMDARMTLQTEPQPAVELELVRPPDDPHTHYLLTYSLDPADGFEAVPAEDVEIAEAIPLENGRVQQVFIYTGPGLNEPHLFFQFETRLATPED
ncbi:MAG: PQQ-dependent sugar dehydrogenase [Opitutales bacterium]